jgi:hypothetical protein
MRIISSTLLKGQLLYIYIYICVCVCVCVCVIESLWAQLPLFQAFLIIDYIINYVLITQV